jgi:K+-transporting ATPase ATPase A chain
LPKTHERIIYRLCGINPAIEQRRTTYAGSCLAFAQNFRPYQTVTTIGGATQTIALGPVASHEPVKLLSSDGGGFFNANSAHPFEDPTPLANFAEMLLILAIPTGLTYTFGRMVNDQRQGWALFVTMAVLFACGSYVASWSELLGTILLVMALTFFPVLSLGPQRNISE